jgi:plasmid stability protein
MPDILVRGLDPDSLKRLKARARRHGRSLQSEARLVLEQAAGTSAEEIGDMLERWRVRFAGRRLAGSSALVREDRER